MAGEDKKEAATAGIEIVENPDGTANIVIKAADEKPQVSSTDADAAAIAAATGAVYSGPGGESTNVAAADDDDEQTKTPEQIAEEDKADPARARIRAQRREEKQRRKQHQQNELRRRDMRIDALERELRDMNERLGGVTAVQQRDAVRMIDQGIATLEARRQDLAGIIASPDASNEQRAEATLQLTDTATRLGQLKATREQAVRNVEQQRTNGAGATDVTNGARPRGPDPRLVSLANSWMAKHPWYNPNNPDQDTRVVMAIDAQLTQERWDPTSQEYWDELDARAKTYLPNRFTSGGGRDTVPSHDGSGNGSRNGSGPRGPAGGADKGAGGGGNSIQLSAERVQAIKDAGAWDDPKERSKMIQSYIAYDKQAAASGR